jgi:ubiquinone/menaquinone biosynthesis C-methylase UbiE
MRRLWSRFLRLFFLLLYNECAWAYDLVAWAVSFGQWQAWGRTAIPHLQGGRVLELGHGPGHLLVTMAHRGLSPVGLDVSPAMGRLARSNLARSNVQVPLVRARAQALPFRDGCFDSSLATFPTEFILDRATACEMARVLPDRGPTAPESGGRLVVVGWVRLSAQRWSSRLLAWLYRVTGQGAPREGWVPASPVARAFDVHPVVHRLGLADVVLLIGDKRLAGSVRSQAG